MSLMAHASSGEPHDVDHLPAEDPCGHAAAHLLAETLTYSKLWLFALAGFGFGLCRLLSTSWTRGLPIDGSWADEVAAVGHGLHPQVVQHMQFAAQG
eukprot:2180091-Amphidinium_carterae.1